MLFLTEDKNLGTQPLIYTAQHSRRKHLSLKLWLLTSCMSGTLTLTSSPDTKPLFLSIGRFKLLKYVGSLNMWAPYIIHQELKQALLWLSLNKVCWSEEEGQEGWGLLRALGNKLLIFDACSSFATAFQFHFQRVISVIFCLILMPRLITAELDLSRQRLTFKGTASTIWASLGPKTSSLVTCSRL